VSVKYENTAIGTTGTAKIKITDSAGHEFFLIVTGSGNP
jgi:hypothetical protein